MPPLTMTNHDLPTNEEIELYVNDFRVWLERTDLQRLTNVLHSARAMQQGWREHATVNNLAEETDEYFAALGNFLYSRGEGFFANLPLPKPMTKKDCHLHVFALLSAVNTEKLEQTIAERRDPH